MSYAKPSSKANKMVARDVAEHKVYTEKQKKRRISKASREVAAAARKRALARSGIEDRIIARQLELTLEEVTG
jgi:hypothetical protein